MLKFADKDTGTVLDYGLASGKGGELIKKRFPNCNLTGIDAVAKRLESKEGINVRLLITLQLEHHSKTYRLT